MRARIMGFFPRLNALALAPLGLGPENLAKHNFKSTMSQLAELNFLELRFSAKHRLEMMKNKKTLRNPERTHMSQGQVFCRSMMPDG
jgi:hypothetical protein